MSDHFLLAWILSLMLSLQPAAPWREDYYHVAKGILEGAKAIPVFSGQHGVFRTIALNVSLAWHESRFNRYARGDQGKSWGLFQYQNHGTPEDAAEQTKQANRLILQSFRVCKDKPLNERLGWYAAGGNGCERGLRESRNRMNKAKILAGE